MARLSEPWCLPNLEVVCCDAPTDANWLWDRVVPPPPEIAASVASGGLQFASIREADAQLFVEAAAAVGAMASLARTVAERVGIVHVLRADVGYDVSHSEPQWADRIFVSVPERRDRVGALRLAESVIHEAMHLQLTDLEATFALVRDLSGQLRSPWRRAPRPVGGVFHGLFVFTCLRAFFEAHREPMGSAAAQHVHRRLEEIDGEIAEIDVNALAAGLTPGGTALLSRLLAAGVQA